MGALHQHTQARLWLFNTHHLYFLHHYWNGSRPQRTESTFTRFARAMRKCIGPRVRPVEGCPPLLPLTLSVGQSDACIGGVWCVGTDFIVQCADVAELSTHGSGRCECTERLEQCDARAAPKMALRVLCKPASETIMVDNSTVTVKADDN